MSLTVTDARVDGEAVGLRAEGGRIVELGKAVDPREFLGPAPSAETAGRAPAG